MTPIIIGSHRGVLSPPENQQLTSAGKTQAIDNQSVFVQPPVKDSLGPAKDAPYLQIASSTLSMLETTQDLLDKAHSWGLLALSDNQKAHLKTSDRIIGFFSSLTSFVEKCSKGSALRTLGIGFSFLAVSTLSLYANLFNNKQLQEIAGPIGASVGLMAELSSLETQSKTIQSQGVSKISLCKLCKSLSSITKLTLTLASFATTGAISFPLFLYAVVTLQTGCETVLSIHDYLASFSLVAI